MNFLQKAERKFGKYAIKNLSMYIVIGYIVGYILEYAFPAVYNVITLNPYLILHGQVWRIVTWIIVPPEDLSIFTIIMIIFYYSIGNSLENTWGKFRYNAYIFSGILFTVIGAFVVYFVLQFTTASDIAALAIGAGISTMFSTYYINLSIFLAFAVCYPEMRVMLYFIIPIKIKWLAYLYTALILLSFISSDWAVRAAIIASLLNFILFFFTTRNYSKVSPTQIKRKHDFRKKVHNAQSGHGNGPKHKCAVCGRTELDGDNLVFRYCSKCEGNYEYCQDHLFTHEHKRV